MALGDVLGKPKELRTYSPDARWVLPKSMIGLEFEYEGVHDVPLIFEGNQLLKSSWTTHKDDSLKDNGTEFIFASPMFGADAYNAIQGLMEGARKLQWKCSVRAGIHVHLDVRDLELSQLIGFIILYTIVEPILFQWIGDNRENFIFCIPFYKADESLLETCKLVKSALQDEKYQSNLTYGVSKKFNRYSALNLQALSKFGSVEFRHMRTTHDFPRVIDWINMIQSLKAATFKLPTSDGAIIKTAKSTPSHEFLKYVFGNELAAKLWTADAPRLMHEVGIPTAKDLVLYGLKQKDWEELQVPEGKHYGFNRFLERARDVDAKKKEELKKIVEDYKKSLKKGGYDMAFAQVNAPGQIIDDAYVALMPPEPPAQPVAEQNMNINPPDVVWNPLGQF